eukprot:3449906-Rhodomonas_salina.1
MPPMTGTSAVSIHARLVLTRRIVELPWDPGTDFSDLDRCPSNAWYWLSGRAMCGTNSAGR